MSGHSKWATIKHDKGIKDAKKGKIFSKYSQLIITAVREGGADPASNTTLRLLIEKAKSESMPADNIKKAVARGSGSSDDGKIIYEPAVYEGFGPHGVNIMVDVLTDNKNRTVAELKLLFSESGGIFGEPGAVSWNFDHKGMIVARPGKLQRSEKFGGEDTFVESNKDEVMMELLDIEGVTDIKEENGEDGVVLNVYTEIVDLGRVKGEIFEKGYVIKESSMVRLPKTLKELTQEEKLEVESFVDVIAEHDDVQNVWSNAS